MTSRLLRRLIFPSDLVDRNANRLKRDLRRLYSAYRRGWINKLEAHSQGSREIIQSAENMRLRVQAYIERKGLTWGGDTGFLEEAVDEAVARWIRVVNDWQQQITRFTTQAKAVLGEKLAFFASKTCTSEGDPGACSCTEHMSLQAAPPAYWTTPTGIRRRVDGLSQDMNYRLVNNAMRMIAPVNGVQWLQWVTSRDDRVCPLCIAAAQGGEGHGYYRVTWFMPQFPRHIGCRCMVALLFYNPQTPTIPRT